MTISDALLGIAENQAGINKCQIEISRLMGKIIKTFDQDLTITAEKIGKLEKEMESLKNQVAEKKKLKIKKNP